ncbi:MAG: helix-turn-helix transcriptional regulator [Clostridia bacterium]|nr:helix-turn-helix transcriptional regulator [Clostridia bacterium]
MYDENFALRLAQLRSKKGVSARDMSLSLGQNPGYINNIENGKSLPSMTTFFYICEYLDITPDEFFSKKSNNPVKINELVKSLNTLSDNELDAIINIVKCINKN